MLRARRIDERDVPSVLRFNQVRANVLRKCPRFARDHVAAMIFVQERRLAVIDVPQHGNDRRSRGSFSGIFLLPLKRPAACLQPKPAS